MGRTCTWCSAGERSLSPSGAAGSSRGEGLDIEELYRRLSACYDVKGWWPAESPWEIMVGAMLTQQTVWENVERVLSSLKARGLMSVDAVVGTPLDEMEAIVRPAGFYRQKARNIKALAAYIQERYSSDPMGLLRKDPEEARKELLSLPGIGNETADVIMLFAGKAPSFVAAAYVSRVLGRTGVYDSDDYTDLKRFVESRMAPEPERYAHFYALLVKHARSTCRKRPRCSSCALGPDCRFSSGTGR